MSHLPPPPPYTSQQTSKILNNQNDERSFLQQNYAGVRQAVRKIDKPEKSNAFSSSYPPPRPPPPRPPIPTSIKKNYIDRENDSSPSSNSSSIQSTNSENIINSNSIERIIPSSNERSTKNSTTKINPLTKSNIRTNIQTKKQSKPINHRRRPPPPIPLNTSNYLKQQQNITDDSVYVNSNNKLKKYQNTHQENDLYELHYENDHEESEIFNVHAQPIFISKEHQISSSLKSDDNIRTKIPINNNGQRNQKSSYQNKNSDLESVGLEIPETNTPTTRRNLRTSNGYDDNRRDNVQRAPFTVTDYKQNEIQEQNGDKSSLSSHGPPPLPPPLPPPTNALPSFHKQQQQQRANHEETYSPKRFLPLSNFMMESGALLIVFILCMVLVLAIREDETNLRTTMQLVYTYIYFVSIIWMIWCTFDIIKFRRQWRELTAPAISNEEYMDISERHTNKIFYFPDIHNTGGLFMRIGAGLFCMGSLIVTVIELAKTIVIGSGNTTRVSSIIVPPLLITVTKSMTYILRFLFHCVQFTFLFRYGNIVINRYQVMAKIGLIHLIIANFCTWFEAIVFETLEQLHKSPQSNQPTSSTPHVTYPTTTTTTSVITIDDNITNSNLFDFVRAMSGATSHSDTGTQRSTLDVINQIESTINIYLYPCLIEYSLIALTVFFLMWRNVGKTRGDAFLRFSDRHIFTVNCARASRGLLIGGIIILLTILTLIPTYLLNDDAIAVTHITELVLLTVSLFIVFIGFIHTTKLYHDPHAHVDAFDRVLILVTTFGDFAYSFFGLFASIFIDRSKSQIPIGIEISIGFLAIFQTFLQSGFILDTLKRRTKSKFEIRNKPGRETVTALLLINLAIWLHDTFSAKKVRLNPIQTAYYDAGTWAIIQAFTSPLSIFYRFHSSVCLADIWQEVYGDSENHNGIKPREKFSRHRLANMNSRHDTEH
ncbi:unnamed protein product [Rotaria sordida]|uniref:Otopetrin n=1 Tax=Rotaria sordida TaxID=392033 RepID=A0A814XQ15_9BILA|nr:unnamed protein product [Rotaria sordida]CAF1495476.1 unnamed protein product [Rotaria sordida]